MPLYGQDSSARSRRRLQHIALWSALVLPASGGCRSTTTSEAQPETSQTKALAAAAPAAPELSVPRVVLSPPGQDPVTVTVEVVDNNETRQRGLMYRKHLDPEAGMLFIFDREEHHTFWMHNTLIPLDMLFIKADWTVLGIVENAEPMTDSMREVPGESRYVLEVNAGFSRRHGLQAGTSVRYITAGQGI
jgi:uncharacterized membrane protein (UPF0127 family)